MTYLEALDALAHHPHLWRFRQLCAEDNPDPVQRDAYRNHVIQIASGGEHAEFEQGPSLQESWDCCGEDPYGPQ